MNTTELIARLKLAAEKASNGEWVKESGDGWEAACSANDRANSGFIIAHFEGPDAAANREFVQAANPVNVLALVEALESAQRKIAELENDEVRQRLANAEHQLHMAELAKHNLRASRMAQFKKRKAAEKRIAELEARTVTLPEPIRAVALGRDFPALQHSAVVTLLREAGIKCEVKGE